MPESNAFERLLQKVRTRIGDQAKDLSVITVRTFAVSAKGSSKPTDERLVVETEIDMIDGDIKHSVPVDGDGRVNQELLSLHREAVSTAFAQRAETVANIVKLANALNALLQKN